MADTDTTTPEPVQPTSDDDSNSLESLEGPDSSTLEGSDASPVAADSGSSADAPLPPAAPPPSKKTGLVKRLSQRLNIYLMLFGLVILLTGGIILVAYLQSHHAAKASSVQTQSLSQSTLDQLASNDATVGSSQSVLNVKSSAIFAGQVLVRQNLQIAGNLQIGGTVALSNLAVSGTSQVGQAVVTKNLAVAGDTAIQGATTIGKSLQVSGSGNFSGSLSAPQITTSSLQLNGDLALTHHVTTSGGTPARSSGPALGSGGSVSVSGSDTAGSISINTGSSPAGGCFATITFTTRYSSTPHVLVTPVGSAGGGLSYYVDRSATSFSICDATAPPGGSSFGFDYFVID